VYIVKEEKVEKWVAPDKVSVRFSLAVRGFRPRVSQFHSQCRRVLKQSLYLATIANDSDYNNNEKWEMNKEVEIYLAY